MTDGGEQPRYRFSAGFLLPCPLSSSHLHSLSILRPLLLPPWITLLETDLSASLASLSTLQITSKRTCHRANLTSLSSPSVIIGSRHGLLWLVIEHRKFSRVAHVCSLTGLNNMLWQCTQALFSAEGELGTYAMPLPLTQTLPPTSPHSLVSLYSEG